MRYHIEYYGFEYEPDECPHPGDDYPPIRRSQFFREVSEEEQEEWDRIPPNIRDDEFFPRRAFSGNYDDC
ncbi:MAG: hypothetical protein HQ567_19955 [Candidatus Nealsonbacteria bacterium]|nr:hypothetical protein [Candidatus Nealsonbacteria bacterium]